MFPCSSNVTPGISFEPFFLGPTPDRKSKFPTFFACGYAPTGSGALSEFIMLTKFEQNWQNHSGAHRLSPLFSWAPLRAQLDSPDSFLITFIPYSLDDFCVDDFPSFVNRKFNEDYSFNAFFTSLLRIL